MPSRSVPAWLTGSVLYQIYPQSFADSNGDGIGDLPGVLEHLDHLAWLGVTTVWLNPCFVSPFEDAGYDVADYLSIAPRYGTAADLAALVEAARARGIRVLLDLVPGHTSDQHPWFRAAADDQTDQRYIWADRQAPGFVPSPGLRPGFFLKNFYDIQPALNFGYARPDRAEPWRQPVDAEGPAANRAALREIMAYWLRTGVSGFRVDMAFSLVKDDPDRRETAALWGELTGWLHREHPDAVLLSEWGDPAVAVPAGFDADFFLHFVGRSLVSLWDNRTGTIQEYQPDLPCYFDAEGRGSAREFLAEWSRVHAALDGRGHAILPSANHDFSRLACGPRTAEQLGAAFTFLLTWPTLPAIYYGDEIGMRFVSGLPDTEGSRLSALNDRTGSRTPMQWDSSPNAGFSTAPADRLYLPIDPDPGRPTVAAQRADEGSLLHLVRRLIALRKAHPALGADAAAQVLTAGYPLVYLRGGTHLVVVNPRREPARVTVPLPAGRPRPLLAEGVTAGDGAIEAAGFGYGVFEF